MTSLKKFAAGSLATAALLLLGGSANAQIASNYVTGRISNVTFIGEAALIMVDTGLPTNCIGTSWGWMRIPPEYKSMSAFVLGLWMRGDASSVVVSVYTDGLVGGYCRITQIDPTG